MSEYQRRVVCAANMCPKTGQMLIGPRHWDLTMHNQHSIYGYAGKGTVKFTEQGFIDQHGEFMTRQEAWKVAEAAGQIIRRVGGDNLQGGTLFSENIY